MIDNILLTILIFAPIVAYYFREKYRGGNGKIERLKLWPRPD